MTRHPWVAADEGVRFGLVIPGGRVQTPESGWVCRDDPVPTYLRAGRLAERLGFDAVFAGDYSWVFPDPFVYLSEPALLILESLATGDKHGYAMMDDIKRRHEIDLGPGTLYGAITRLEEAGLIEAMPPEERRRPYRLTSAGQAALAEQLRSLRRFASGGLERLTSS